MADQSFVDSVQKPLLFAAKRILQTRLQIHPAANNQTQRSCVSAPQRLLHKALKENLHYLPAAGGAPLPVWLADRFRKAGSCLIMAKYCQCKKSRHTIKKNPARKMRTGFLIYRLNSLLSSCVVIDYHFEIFRVPEIGKLHMIFLLIHFIFENIDMEFILEDHPGQFRAVELR